MPWILLALGVGAAALVWFSAGIWKSNPEDFAEDVKKAYEQCDGQEIGLLAAKHNLQLVFEPCGSNNFLHYQWAPSGIELFYQTNSGPWLLNGETKELRALQIGVPIGNTVWFNDDLVAFPEKGVKSYNIDVYDVRKNIINITGLALMAPDNLVRGREVDEVLFLAAEREPDPTHPDDHPPRSIYRLRANTGTVERAFPWLDGPVLDFTYHAGQDLLAFRTGEEGGVTVARGSTGEVVRTFPDRERVSVSSDGRFWAIEGDGDPIPLFNQKTDEEAEVEAADGASGTAESPELERLAALTMDQEYAPPTIWILDTTTDREVRLPDVFGYHFQWYEAQRYYCSFVLWGMENKEFNRNIVLTDLTPVLRDQGIDIDVSSLYAEGSEDGAPAAEAP